MSDTTAIRSVLTDYELALNTADADAAAAVYTPDGRFYPDTLPTAQGADLRASYAGIFEAIRLDISFEVHEVVVDGDLAFATTTSRGQVTVLAADVTVPEENREVFVLQRVDGTWGIARYMFNKSSAPVLDGA
jgi:uncharacterized protein (TIGR02246 family)